MNENQLVDVLRRVSSGTLRVDEAERLLAAQETEPQIPPDRDEFHPPDAGCWAQAWLFLLIGGIASLALSAWFMNWAQVNGRGFWFACAWVPLLLSLFVLIFGAWSRGAHWAHVRVYTNDGKTIPISMPVPFVLLAWLLRIFGRFIPQYREQNLSFLPQVFMEMDRQRGLVTVEVHEKDGSQVYVWVT